MAEDKGADAGAAGGGDGAAAAGAAAADPKAGAGAGAGAAGAGAAAAGAGGAAAGADKGGAASGGGAAAVDAKGVWPEDWAARFSKGDEKVAKQIGRYASPEALAEAHIQLRRRMDSGEFKPALPKNPKPAELAAWRKDVGIPEKPDGYDLKGIEYPEQDKEIVNSFLGMAHGQNFTPDQTKAGIKFYYDLNASIEKQRAEKDETERVAAIDALAAEYGSQFSRNKTLVENVLSKFPESVREDFKSARLPSGQLLFNHPDVVRAFVALELMNNPQGIIAHAGNGDLGKSMVDEYKDIQKQKTENRSAWNKNPANDKKERDLIETMVRQGLMDKNGNLIERKAA